MNRFSLKSACRNVFLVLFSFILGIILVEAGMRTAGLIYSVLQERANLISLRRKNAFVILCLGESTTAAGGKSSYPRQLEEELNQMDIGIQFSVINKGQPACDTTEILARLEENLERYHPDMVITMMGINDRRED